MKRLRNDQGNIDKFFKPKVTKVGPSDSADR